MYGLIGADRGNSKNIIPSFETPTSYTYSYYSRSRRMLLHRGYSGDRAHALPFITALLDAEILHFLLRHLMNLRHSRIAQDLLSRSSDLPLRFLFIVKH